MKKGIITLIFFCYSFLTLSSQDEIYQVDPPYWWIGMENSALQVLIYGDEVGSKYPEIKYAEVDVERVVRVENPNYLFVYLQIGKDAIPGTFKIVLKENNKPNLVIDYELKSRDAGSKDRVGFTSKDVVYLITPDRFANGNQENDHLTEMKDQSGRSEKFGRHGGDIKGILDHMDYISDMGFTSIWLNPVLENDMYRSSYHGYAITDFYKVDPRYGSNELYKEMVSEAKNKGVSVVMDMIMNHCGSEHWFVKDPPSLDWINYKGEYINTSHRRHVNQDIYASDFDKRVFSDGWFVRTMPDLNQRNILFADYLIQNSIWWVEYSGITGIRMDTHPYPDKNFMSRWSCAILDEYPYIGLVGEEWSPQPAIIAYWQKGKKNHDGYVSCMSSMMDFPMQIALTEGLNKTEQNWESGMVPMYEILALDFLYDDPNNLMIFADNHDMDRIYTQVKEDVDLMKMAMGYILTMRGIPQIYYGTEILMENSSAPNDHGIIRTDFPGGWPDDTTNAFSGDGMDADATEFQSWMKRILQWRKESSTIHKGKLMQFAPADGIYTYFRYLEDNIVMVVINKNNDERNLPIDHYSEVLNYPVEAKEVTRNESIIVDQGFKIPPRSISIYDISAN
jgi:glycosidase